MNVLMALSLVVATAIPLLVLLGVHRLNLYATSTFRDVLVCFGWGLLAFGIAYGLNTGAAQLGLLSLNEMRRFGAPVVEEIVKALILIALVRRPRFSYFVDGAIYGFATGIGFAIVENYLYILQYPDSAFALALGRVLSTNLMHAAASATIGISTGLFRFQRGLPARAGTVLAGYLVAILLHMSFNNIVTRMFNPVVLYVAAGAYGLTGAAAIALAIRRGIAEARQWIQEKLGMADRVTASEAAVVHRMASLREILAPLEAQFGARKTGEIERLLAMQARLGILRKSVERLPDARSHRAVEDEIVALREEMDKARRDIGLYVMLYLRNILPDEVSPLWATLATRIEAMEADRPAAGPGLWAALGERTAKKTASSGTADSPQS